MRIGLISDTHVPVDAKMIPRQILKLFDGVDLILHAGDVYEPSVLDELGSIAPLLVAQGDDDFELDHDVRVKMKHDIRLEDIPVSLTHTEPGLGPWSVFPDTMKHPEPGTYSYHNISGIMVFGHTHMPKLQFRGGYIFINPGSPTFPYYVCRPGTVVLLDLDADKAEVRFIQLD